MTAAEVTPVECYGITGQQTPHESRKISVIAAKQQMEMIGDKRPSKAVGASFHQQAGQALYKATSIIIVQKNIGTFNPPDDDVLQKARDVDSSLSWHGGKNSRKVS